MSGEKRFTNNTHIDLQVALTVRARSNPEHDLACVPFFLDEHETKTIKYGNDENPYLNAIVARSTSNHQLTATKLGVIERGSAIDNLLNTHNHITFTLVNQSIVITGSNI
ncbi:hypothetical protein V6615_09590 [Oscillospiraceae bacterium PP1C4]